MALVWLHSAFILAPRHPNQLLAGLAVCLDPVEIDPGTDIAVSSATKAIAPNRPFQRSSSARPAAFSMTIWRCIPFKNRR